MDKPELDQKRKRVVSAVIIRTEHGGQKRVLLTMRDGRSDFANHWECPGGKVEEGEDDAEALIRELREELGINSLLVDRLPVGAVDLDPPLVKKPLRVTFYRVDVSPEEDPYPYQARCLAYFESEALDSLLLMPANKALCEKVKECLVKRFGLRFPDGRWKTDDNGNVLLFSSKDEALERNDQDGWTSDVAEYVPHG